MAQIGHYKRGMNMVGTAQVNPAGAKAKATVDAMKKTKKGTHKLAMWQQLPLVFAVWAYNAIVKSLSNFHSPTIIQDPRRCQTAV